MLRSPPSRRRGLKSLNLTCCPGQYVASFAEAWIEMVIHNIHNNIHSTSPPSRRRGLKYRLLGGNKMSILSPPSRRRGLKLTMQEFPTMQIMSPPSRRRGLKSMHILAFYYPTRVASIAEAWIEIKKTVSRCLHLLGRLLRGGVD